MTLKILHGIQIAIFTTGIVLACCLVSSAQVIPPYKITGIRILNFNQYTNIFSKDISEDKDYEFWNALQVSLFVSVEVSGKADTRARHRNVEVRVYEGRKMVLRRVGKIGYIAMDGKFYVPALLEGSFCQPVTVKARIVGQRQISSISKTLTFACGE